MSAARPTAHEAAGARAGGDAAVPSGFVGTTPRPTATDDVGAVFGALADPTRRDVLGRLRDGSTVTASALADELPMTRQAVAKHLRALADAGLVTARRSGRETHYGAVPGALDGATAWMVQAGARWDDRLERLRRRHET